MWAQKGGTASARVPALAPGASTPPHARRAHVLVLPHARLEVARGQARVGAGRGARRAQRRRARPVQVRARLRAKGVQGGQPAQAAHVRAGGAGAAALALVRAQRRAVGARQHLCARPRRHEAVVHAALHALVVNVRAASPGPRPPAGNAAKGQPGGRVRGMVKGSRRWALGGRSV